VPSRPPPLALAYHGIANVLLTDDPHCLFVRPEDVRRHIARVRSWGYELVTFRALAERARTGTAHGLAALTFDDGLGDNVELIEMGVPATVFVVTGFLGGTYPYAPGAVPMLTQADVRNLHAAGIEIGAHTVTHPDLTTLSRAQATEELRRSGEQLAAITGAPVTSVAYPYGRANEETFLACADAGFVAACRSSGLGDWDEPLNLPRQDMHNSGTLIGLRLKRDSRYEPLMEHYSARIIRRLGRHGRQLARRGATAIRR
jgi:peptidoglycan/xylan/chitin deacetylase (PgdA/CDA1 family)